MYLTVEKIDISKSKTPGIRSAVIKNKIYELYSEKNNVPSNAKEIVSNIHVDEDSIITIQNLSFASIEDIDNFTKILSELKTKF
jgi:hypothetical protein